VRSLRLLGRLEKEPPGLTFVRLMSKEIGMVQLQTRLVAGVSVPDPGMDLTPRNHEIR